MASGLDRDTSNHPLPIEIQVVHLRLARVCVHARSETQYQRCIGHQDGMHCLETNGQTPAEIQPSVGHLMAMKGTALHRAGRAEGNGGVEGGVWKSSELG
jgi:hypothetical protein